MILKSISKLIVSQEEYHDGGLEALIFVFKYYIGNDSVVFLNKLIATLYDTKNSFEKLEYVANKYGFLAVVFKDIGVTTLKEFNQPVIINISNTITQNHFIVICKYDDMEGFKIFDPKNGNYYASVAAIQSLWNDNACLIITKV